MSSPVLLRARFKGRARALAEPQGAVRSRIGAGPVIDETNWGYIIRESDAETRLRIAGSITGRFVGAILLMAAAGLWVLPDAIYGADLFGIKLAAMVMFSVLGGYLFWAGRNALRPEFRIDRLHGEIRIGHRSGSGDFRPTARVDFADVVSVFLLRSKDTRPTRLFLRLVDLDTGLEVADGGEAAMERLKERLTADLRAQGRSQPAPRTVARPVRPRRAA
jgi:hypothetical protein